MATATEKNINIKREPARAGFFVSWRLMRMFINQSYVRPIVGGSIVRPAIILKIMNIKEKFGLKVRVLREEKGFSIEQLGNISNVDRNYISDIEKGQRNVSIEIIEKIICALDSDFGSFFNDERFEK